MTAAVGGEKVRRKLIEVAMPLGVVNEHSVADKFPHKGHPSSLHTYWARLPLPACRAVLFASLVDDPNDETERKKLFGVMSELSRWENTDQATPEGVATIEKARQLVAASVGRSVDVRASTGSDRDPGIPTHLGSGITFFDPFAGGGSIPLEAQRLGLKAVAADLNPLAVLINKATLELPFEFQNCSPVAKDVGADKRAGWRGYTGLAHDIRHYAAWVHDEVLKRVGDLYPKVKLSDGTEKMVRTWLWASTLPCTNPSCDYVMPLIKRFAISTKAGRVKFAKPVVNRTHKRVTFQIADDDSSFDSGPTVGRSGATCLACGSFTPIRFLRDLSKQGKLGQQLMALVAEGPRGPVFVDPDSRHEKTALECQPQRRPPGSLPEKAISIRVQLYGFKEWHQLFTERQLTVLCAFNDALHECERKIIADGAPKPYAVLVKTYLALAVGRLANCLSRFSRWDPDGCVVRPVYVRQSIGMTWDFPELNPFSKIAANWNLQSGAVADVVSRLPTDTIRGSAIQADAATDDWTSGKFVIVTDPPYYDNIGYADVSDFFYVWLRDALGDSHPDLFVGTLTPKRAEIVKGPIHDPTGERFEQQMQSAFARLRRICSPEFPTSVFYAYKQKTATKKGVSSSGWEKFLNALTNSGFQVIGTWPIRTANKGKIKAAKASMLVTAIVVVLRPRDPDAPKVTRRQFLDELEESLPRDIERLTKSGIGPADLEQAAIGPGMKVFTKYAGVETIAGQPVSVGEALLEVNRVLDDYYRGDGGDLDQPTSFCRSWHERFEFREHEFGEALTMATPRGLVLDRSEPLGQLVEARGGSFRLLSPEEIVHDVNRPPPSTATTAWEGCMRVVYHMENGEGRGGVDSAADVVAAMGTKSEQIVRLCRILFNHYDQKFEPSKSRVYNDVVNQWPEIMAEARNEVRSQTRLATA